MMAGVSLLQRAESCRFRLLQAAQEQQDDNLRVAVARVRQQASEYRQQLTDVAELAARLNDPSITFGAPQPTVSERARKSRTGLRQAASRALRADDIRQGCERLTSSATSEDLGGVRILVDELERQANRAVDRWRRDRLPASLDEPLIDLPGMSAELRARMTRVRDLLLKTVDKQRPVDLPTRLATISTALSQWDRDKAEYDALLRQQNPEVQRFLDSASSGGAMWSLVTPAVRQWLDDPDNAGVVRVVLTS